MRIKSLCLLAPVLVLASLVAAPLLFPKPEARRLEVLFFGAPTANGPNHDPITRYRVLKKNLGTEGINLTYLEDPSVAFTKDVLNQFDAVLMYGNWNQNGPMPADQLGALLSYVDNGGGFLPIHCASACYGGSPEFIKLVGGRFASHGAEVFEVRDVKPNHPILKGLKGFEAWDETYVHDNHADDREILQKREDEPWTWVRSQGEGRVFYTAAGHDHRVWDLPEYHALLRNAIYWAVGAEKYQLLAALDLPELEQERVSLPGYRDSKEITRAQKPLPVEESMKLAQVPPGMELSLFASDPDIVNPIYVAWDHRGRAFVVETIDYPNNLQRRNLGHDRITICEDTDGDGRADKFTRFAEKLSIPTSLVFANGGVICTNGSELLFLKDTDGDDRADVRETLIDGFGMGDTHAGPSNLRYGFDGWIYATVGYSGFNGEVGGEHHQFAQAVFRFRSDGSKMEFLQNTTNNTWGLGFTEEFDVIGSTANGNPSWFMTLPRSDYRLGQLDQPRTPRADSNPFFFPSSTDIRQVDAFDRYTAGAGHAVYTARRLPEEYHNRIAFVCAPTGKLVGNFEMTRDGAGWKAELLPNNIYNSGDAWSAPVFAEPGPDGAVWVADWYNLIIQHNPTPTRDRAGIDAQTGRGNAYETPLRDKEHGRIYRIYPKGSPNDAKPELDPAEARSLVVALDHPNLFWRLQAQRLLVENGHGDAAEMLAQAVKAGEFAPPHALHALANLGRLGPELLLEALASNHSSLRRAAIAVAGPSDLKMAFIKDGTIAAEGRELAEVLAGFARGASDPEIGAAIFRVGRDQQGEIFSDETLRDAWQIAARRQADGVLAAAGDLAAKRDAEGANLLPNADFSEVVDGAVTGWTDLRTFGGGNRRDAVEFGSAPDGRSGTCLTISSDQRIGCGVFAQVKVKPGTRYRLRGWIKTEGLAGGRRGGGAYLSAGREVRTEMVEGTSGWTEVSTEFDVRNEEEISVTLLFGGFGGARGQAWFDDISLVPIGSANTLKDAVVALEEFRSSGGKGDEPMVRTHKPDPEVHARGQEVYSRTCIACHGVGGQGVPETFPPIDGSDWLTGDPELPIKIVLNGLQGPVEVGGHTYNNVMAPLGPLLSDEEVADVLTFVRQSWTNDAAPVEAADVKAVRDEVGSRTQMWTAEELGR